MKRKSVYKAIVTVLCFLLITLVIIGIFGLIERLLNKSNNLSDESMNSDTTGEMYYNGEKYVLNKNISSMLLLGIDSSEASSSDRAESAQSDFVLLIVFDESAETYQLIHINRDTMVEVRQLDEYGSPKSTYTAQLALSHSYGSTDSQRCRNTAYSVSKLLYGIGIDHYMSMTMDAVPVLNDGVGGVTVELLDDFTHLDPEMTEGATVTLMGECALAYVQERGQLEDSTNLARMERQKQYLSTLLEKISSLDSEEILKVMNDAGEYLYSDCSVNQLTDLFDSMSSYTFKGITSIEGEAVKGDVYMEFHADDESVKQLIVDTFYIKSE